MDNYNDKDSLIALGDYLSKSRFVQETSSLVMFELQLDKIDSYDRAEKLINLILDSLYMHIVHREIDMRGYCDLVSEFLNSKIKKI